MSEYQAIMAQISELEKQAESIRAREKAQVLETIGGLCKDHSLTLSDIRPLVSKERKTNQQRSHPTAGISLPAKYQDGNGNSWTGRGVKPLWLRDALASGRSLESMKV
jgi:DNA-binding protein H-NS